MFRIGRSLVLALIGCSLLAVDGRCQADVARMDAALENVVSNYALGFATGDTQQIRATIGAQLMMVNGNHSDNPANWQAHQFLHGSQIDGWVDMMLLNAGPFTNSVEFESHHVRGHSAVVVTRENGANKFRQWRDEQVAYLLGQTDGQWKIVGLFIPDLSNPD